MVTSLTERRETTLFLKTQKFTISKTHKLVSLYHLENGNYSLNALVGYEWKIEKNILLSAIIKEVTLGASDNCHQY